MDYFDVLESCFIYDNGRVCFCQNKKGEFISSEFIEDTLNKEIARHKKCALTWEKDKNKKFRDYAKLEFEDVVILERIKDILLGGKKNDKKIK